MVIPVNLIDLFGIFLAEAKISCWEAFGRSVIAAKFAKRGIFFLAGTIRKRVIYYGKAHFVCPKGS